MIQYFQPLWLTMFCNSIFCIPWTFLFFLTQFFGVRLYILRNRDECKRVQRKIGKCCSHLTDGGKGCGYSFGYWYILSIDVSNHQEYTIMMVATEQSYHDLTRDDTISVQSSNDDHENQNDEMITIHERCGAYDNSWYRKRDIRFMMTPRDEQSEIIRDIKTQYDKNHHVVVLIHGPPCRGKSIIGLFVANEYKSSYCNNFRPWQPGDYLGEMIADVDPTEDKPLILVFDEIDVVMQKIHIGIPPHNSLPICTPDKTGWNKLLDDIQLGLYPNLIIIMTSNSSINFFHELDPSYMRDGRIDLVFSL